VSRKPSRAPQGEPFALRREIEDVFRRLAAVSVDGGIGEWTPSADLYETDGRFVLVMEVPGLGPESLRVAYADHQLTVSGERRHRRPPGAVGFLCLERPQGRFHRVIPVEEALDVARAEARLTRGLLIIEIPRLKDRRGRETVIPVRQEGKE
jgi:HSP20 family protein